LVRLGVKVKQGKPSYGMAIEPFRVATSLFNPLEVSNTVPIVIYYKIGVTLRGNFQGIFEEVC
jgi:hypothetical protein